MYIHIIRVFYVFLMFSVYIKNDTLYLKTTVSVKHLVIKMCVDLHEELLLETKKLLLSGMQFACRFYLKHLTGEKLEEV